LTGSENELGLEALLAILTAAAVALDILHRHGVVHGRLSSASLRVAPTGSEPAVYLTGLGIVDDRSTSTDVADDRAALARVAYDALAAIAGSTFAVPAALTDERLATVDTCTMIVSQLADTFGAARAAGEDVQFTVYRPAALEPDRWCSLLAFAHLASGAQPPDSPDPLEEVARQAEAILGPTAASYQQLTQDSRATVPRASGLTFRLRVPGLEVNPVERSFHWIEDVHREEFRVRAPGKLEGTTVRGEF